MIEAEKFFEKNRKYKTSLNKLPLIDSSDEDIALWILKGGHGDWLRLNLKIDFKKFLQEEKFAEDSYVSHRDNSTDNKTHVGWHSCTLHGISVDKTNHWSVYGYSQEPEYSWTELGNKTKAIKSFCEQLPFERLARVRFMKLSPKGFISPHNDGGDGIDWENIWNHPLPINIAIDHPPSCFMTIENSGVVPFKNGQSYLVNILKTHSVINFSDQKRKHLIVHGIVGNKKDKYCRLLADSYRNEYHKIQSQVR